MESLNISKIVTDALTGTLNKVDQNKLNKSLKIQSLEKQTNRRFGFYFKYPKTWQLNYSIDRDGFRIKNPDYIQVKIVFYRSHFEQWVSIGNDYKTLDNETIINKIIKEHKQNLRQNKSTKIYKKRDISIRLEDVYSNKNLTEFNDSIYNVYARYYEYPYKDNLANKKYKALETLAIYNNFT